MEVPEEGRRTGVLERRGKRWKDSDRIGERKGEKGHEKEGRRGKMDE